MRSNRNFFAITSNVDVPLGPLLLLLELPYIFFFLGVGMKNLITVKSPAKCSFHSAINTQQVRVRVRVDVVLVDLNTYKDLTTFCYSCVPACLSL